MISWRFVSRFELQSDSAWWGYIREGVPRRHELHVVSYEETMNSITYITAAVHSLPIRKTTCKYFVLGITMDFELRNDNNNDAVERTIIKMFV